MRSKVTAGIAQACPNQGSLPGAVGGVVDVVAAVLGLLLGQRGAAHDHPDRVDLAAGCQELASGSGRERGELELRDPGAGQEVVDRAPLRVLELLDLVA